MEEKAKFERMIKIKDLTNYLMTSRIGNPRCSKDRIQEIVYSIYHVVLWRRCC